MNDKETINEVAEEIKDEIWNHDPAEGTIPVDRADLESWRNRMLSGIQPKEGEIEDFLHLVREKEWVGKDDRIVPPPEGERIGISVWWETKSCLHPDQIKEAIDDPDLELGVVKLNKGKISLIPIEEDE